MELRHLEHFVAVAEERNFTRAAARLHLAQSGLSSSVRALERELGAELFVRTPRGAELTEAGRALPAEARRTLDSAAAARDAVAATRGVVGGTLTVGAEQCMGAVDPLGVVAAYTARYPSVGVRVEQAGSALLLERLARGGLDVAFVAGAGAAAGTGAGGGVPEGLRLRSLATEPLVLICPPDHPLADRPTPPALADLADEAFVELTRHWGARRAADAAFAAQGVSRAAGLQLDDVHKVLEMVARGAGVALMPRSVTRKEQARTVRGVPLADDIAWEVSVAHSRPTPASRAFLALLALLEPGGGTGPDRSG
ncbi:LysR family transcriptional regulator [Streptomyces sp. TRM49041]|uniref:LysR family transcriptional regulator n=1 Tax=Streptomyces sp. TRM49041 TaxID=2603216 RepID=UPI0011EE3EDE|nr:LysR family transcriptional regulator [Streptomyces sp. TRM49041]